MKTVIGKGTRDSSKDRVSTLIHAAWLSVLLGLGMEVLLLVVAACFKHSASAQVIVADLVQKISWSTLVCVGIAVGSAAGKLLAAMPARTPPLSGIISSSLNEVLFPVGCALVLYAAEKLAIKAEDRG